jgi:FkbM family methyltransferase
MRYMPSSFYAQIRRKIRGNISIYKSDVKAKGVYWSIVHRILKIPLAKPILTPIINRLKPDYIIINNHKFYIDKKDENVSQELVIHKEWEPYETTIFKKHIKRGDVILDLGAHIGYYTLIAAGIVGNKGKVYAFEPCKKNFTILEKNVCESGYKNIILVNKAVSNKTGKTRLFLHSINSGDNRLFFDPKEKMKEEIVEQISLDKYFKNKYRKVDLIKLDIQGSEALALTGAENLIKKNRNIKLISEYSPRLLDLSGINSKSYLDFLTKCKFNIYKVLEKPKKIEKISPDKLYVQNLKDPNFETNLLCIRQM